MKHPYDEFFPVTECQSTQLKHEHSEIKNKLKNLVKLNNFHQLIDDPTRDLNLLDLLITDAPNYFINSGVLPSLPSLDHEAIFGTFKFSYKKQGSYIRHIWQYDRGNFDELNLLLDNTDWNMNINNETELNNAVQYLTTTIIDKAKLTIPNKTVKIKRCDKPCFNNHLRSLFRERNRLHKLKNRTNNPYHLELYKTKRNEATNAYRESKRNYYTKITEKILDPTTSSKNYWKLIKNTLGNKQSTSIPSLIENNKLIHDDREKAEILNNFFASQTNIPTTNTPIPEFTYHTDARLSQVQITPSHVEQILLKLDISKANGHDEISNMILKKCARSISNPLAYIFNKSLSLGIFPSSWKEAMVTALFKKLNKQIKDNYRPISLLSCISKLFERLVFNSSYKYLRTHRLLNENNSGFAKNDSAVLVTIVTMRRHI
jgi:hypothetical protein